MNETFVEYTTDTDVCVAFTTCPDETVAAHIAHELVERGLAACVTRLPGACSVYRWQGKIEEAAEVQLIIKTRRANVASLAVALAELHPYDEPEFFVVEANGGRRAYLDWIEEVTTEVAA